MLGFILFVVLTQSVVRPEDEISDRIRCHCSEREQEETDAGEEPLEEIIRRFNQFSSGTQLSFQ